MKIFIIAYTAVFAALIGMLANIETSEEQRAEKQKLAEIECRDTSVPSYGTPEPSGYADCIQQKLAG